MKCDVCNEEKEGKFYHRVQTDNKVACHDCYWNDIFTEVQIKLDKEFPVQDKQGCGKKIYEDDDCLCGEKTTERTLLCEECQNQDEHAHHTNCPLSSQDSKLPEGRNPTEKIRADEDTYPDESETKGCGDLFNLTKERKVRCGDELADESIAICPKCKD